MKPGEVAVGLAGVAWIVRGAAARVGAAVNVYLIYFMRKGVREETKRINLLMQLNVAWIHQMDLYQTTLQGLVGRLERGGECARERLVVLAVVELKRVMPPRVAGRAPWLLVVHGCVVVKEVRSKRDDERVRGYPVVPGSVAG